MRAAIGALAGVLLRQLRYVAPTPPRIRSRSATLARFPATSNRAVFEMRPARSPVPACRAGLRIVSRKTRQAAECPAPFAQRRQVDLKSVDAVIQIRPQPVFRESFCNW